MIIMGVQQAAAVAAGKGWEGKQACDNNVDVWRVVPSVCSYRLLPVIILQHHIENILANISWSYL